MTLGGGIEIANGSADFLRKDLAEAVEWVKRCPNPMPGPSEIEIRPVVDIADFGDAVTPEVAELHDRNREKAAGR